MSVQTLLDLLEKVRKTGTNQWSACCPAHDDQHPSLAISETDDGRVLVYCRAGCGAADIVHGVGLQMTDLMPERTGEWKSPWWAQQERKAREDVETKAMIRRADRAAGRKPTPAELRQRRDEWVRANRARS